jgi:hypothetical protein
MGLDVYAGTLTRYLSGDWELATERAAREMGLELQVVRHNQPEDAVTDPEEIRPAVVAWREALSNALGVPLEWNEDFDAPYFTDKPDWGGYTALLLLAAHEEHPDIPLPPELPDDPGRHPLLRAIDGQGRRGVFGRRKADAEAPRYASLYRAELWLPAATEDVWTAEFITGDDVTMASTQALLADLEDLARRVGGSPELLDEWRESGGVGEVVGVLENDGQKLEQLAPGSVEDQGRFALAVFLELAERAVEHRLPIKLDY